MRIFFLLLILFNSNSVYSDTYEVVEDYNYETQRSNSEDYTDRNRKVVTINNKTYFSAVIDAGLVPDSSIRTTEKRLVVTDGSSSGTSYVVGLEDTNLVGRLLAFERVGDKLLIALRNRDSSTVELWEVVSETNEAVLVQEIPRTGGLSYFYNNAEVDRYKEGKAVITSKSSSSIIIFNSIDSSIEIIDTKEIVSDQVHKISEIRYVSGEYVYYQKILPDSQYAIYRVHLENKEIEFVANSRIGWSHITVQNKIYFVRFESPGKYAIYSIDTFTKTLTKEYDDINFSPSEMASIFLIDDNLVFNSYDSLIIKKTGSNNFSKLSLPQNVVLEPNNRNLSSKTYFIDSKYYIPARNLSEHSFIILETDLDTYINTTLEFTYSEGSESGYVKYTAMKDNMIYLVTDTDSDVNDYYVGYGTTRGYQWSPSTEELILIWEKDNFNGVSPITENSKDIVFAYTIEKGSEPWSLDFATGNSIQLADLNTDIRTRSSNFRLFSKSNTRAILTYAPVPFREAMDFFELAYGQLNGYLKPHSNPDPTRKDKFVGMDGRYDYFVGTKYPLTIITGYDSQYKNVVELESTKIDEAITDHSELSKARISFMLRDGMYSDSPKYLYQWSIDGERKFQVGHEYNEVIALDDYLLLSGWSNKKNKQKFAVLDNKQEIATFFIECEVKEICSKNWKQIFNEGDHLIIATSSRTGDFKEAYYYNIETGFGPKSIPLEHFTHSLYPRQSPILAIGDDGILFYKNDFSREIFKYDPVTDSFVDYSLDWGTGNDLFYRVGNYYVGLSGYLLRDGKVVVFDKKLNTVSEKSLKSIITGLGYDAERVDVNGYLGCAYGACYIQASLGVNSGLFQIKFDIKLNKFQVIEEEINFQESIWVLKDVIYSKGVTAEFGAELYKHSTSGLDSDGDGMWDSYELAYDLDPFNGLDGAEDLDSDGLTNTQEFQYGTDPTNPNTDGDEVMDGLEISLGYDPREYDTHFHDEDGDGLSFRQEYEAGTDYLNADTDGDGYADGNDAFPVDPSENADFDGDGIGDNADPDDDNDGMPDEWEERYGLNPYDSSDRNTDLDNDGISNYQEYVNGTDPTVANNNSGGGNDNPPSSDAGGGGSMPILLLIILSGYFGFRLRKSI